MPNTASDTKLDAGPHLGTTEILVRKILVAIDFSEPSLRALKTAIAIAQSFGSELFLVSAVAPFVYGDGVPVDSIDIELNAAKANMQSLIAGEPALAALRHHEIVAFSGAIELIEQTARENEVDLVVAGSHGASGIERIVLGSVAECILRKVHCPVLIVGPHSKAELHPFRSVLFATDLKATGLRAAQYASSFAERFHGKLTMLHVLEQKPDSSQPDCLEEPFVKQQLDRLLPADISNYSTVNIFVERGRAGEIIPRTARSECASLMVTGLREKSSVAEHSPWSTLSRTIRESPCPVLIVHRRL